MRGSNRRLCMLNQCVSMCDLLLPTGFKGPNVILAYSLMSLSIGLDLDRR